MLSRVPLSIIVFSMSLSILGEPKPKAATIGQITTVCYVSDSSKVSCIQRSKLPSKGSFYQALANDIARIEQKEKVYTAVGKCGILGPTVPFDPGANVGVGEIQGGAQKRTESAALDACSKQWANGSTINQGPLQGQRSPGIQNAVNRMDNSIQQQCQREGLAGARGIWLPTNGDENRDVGSEAQMDTVTLEKIIAIIFKSLDVSTYTTQSSETSPDGKVSKTVETASTSTEYKYTNNYQSPVARTYSVTANWELTTTTKKKDDGGTITVSIEEVTIQWKDPQNYEPKQVVQTTTTVTVDGVIRRSESGTTTTGTDRLPSGNLPTPKRPKPNPYSGNSQDCMIDVGCSSTCEERMNWWNDFKQSCDKMNWGSYTCQSFVAGMNGCPDPGTIMPNPNGDYRCGFVAVPSKTMAQAQNEWCQKQQGVMRTDQGKAVCAITEDRKVTPPKRSVCNNPRAIVTDDKCSLSIPMPEIPRFKRPSLPPLSDNPPRPGVHR